MPALSPTMEKGNLAKWLKKVGDKVKTGDVIAEIETDKATMEVEAVDEGTLGKIVVAEGTADVPVNQVIAVLLEEGEDKSSIGNVKLLPQPPRSQKRKSKKNPRRKRRLFQQQRQKQRLLFSRLKAKRQAPRTERAPAAYSRRRSRGGSQSKAISTSRGIQGSGPHGRIIARDVEGGPAGTAARAPSHSVPAMPLKAFELPGAMPDDKIKALFEEGSYEFIPHDGMRRTIATRLTAARIQIPQYYVSMDCEIDELMHAREEINSSAPKGSDGKARYKLSVNDFVIKAFALALIKIPAANVTGLRQACCAQAGTPTSGRGRARRRADHADHPSRRRKRRSASSRTRCATRVFARATKTKAARIRGRFGRGSNLGMYGVKNFTAIINPPHSRSLRSARGNSASS